MANKVGHCLLTGEHGKLVKCHIIPQAFTRPSVKGEPLLQSTRGKGHQRRWSSWYDNSLVTRTGEDYLSAIDDAAIKELRKAKLVWSGWGLFAPVFETISPLLPDHGLRILDGLNQELVCLFFWSIAWRASVSKIQDMRHFELPKDVEEKAKRAVLEQKISCMDMQASLIQLSTQGEQHNHSPIIQTKTVPGYSDGLERSIPFARIYLDGLIAHLHLSPEMQSAGGDISIILGDSPKLIVNSVSYKASFQYENMLNLAYESCFGPQDNVV